MAAKFYKYVSTNDFSKYLLEKNEIFFTSPSNFNDPFECQLPSREYERLKLTDFEMLRNLTEAYLTQCQNNNFDALFKFVRFEYPMMINSSEQIIAKAFEYTQARRNYSDEENTFKEEFFKDTGIFCITACYDSILMWSHYADNHKGICIEFDSNKLSQMGDIKDVNYVPAFTDVTTLEDSILMKYDCWSYEQEKRIIKFDWISESDPKNPGLHKMPVNTITGIIFGCKTPVEKVRDFTKFGLRNNSKIRCYSAERVPGEFRLEIKEFDMSSF